MGVALLALDCLVNRLSFHGRWLEHLMQHVPLPIIRNGQTIPGKLRVELLAPEELMRHPGLEDICEMRRADMKSDWRLSMAKMKS